MPEWAFSGSEAHLSRGVIVVSLFAFDAFFLAVGLRQFKQNALT